MPSHHKMSRKSEKFLNIAQKVAELSDFPGYKVGAVIEKSGNVIAVGVNKNTSGFSKDRRYVNACLHAELSAINRIKDIGRGYCVVCSRFDSRR